MRLWMIWLAPFLFCASIYNVSAESIPLKELSRTDYMSVVKALSRTFAMTTVSGASTLGNFYDIEVGVVAGISKVDEITSLTQKNDPDSRVDKLPNLEVFGLMLIPRGVTIEMGLIPNMGSPDFKFQKFSGGVKWTLTDYVYSLPFSLAVKGYFTRTSLRFLAANTKYQMINQSMGAIGVISKNFDIFEPYVGLGLVRGIGEMSVEGDVTGYHADYTQSNTSREKVDSYTYVLGFELKLLLVKVGLEYQSLFEGTRTMGKLSYTF